MNNNNYLKINNENVNLSLKQIGIILNKNNENERAFIDKMEKINIIGINVQERTKNRTIYLIDKIGKLKSSSNGLLLSYNENKEDFNINGFNFVFCILNEKDINFINTKILQEKIKELHGALFSKSVTKIFFIDCEILKVELEINDKTDINMQFSNCNIIHTNLNINYERSGVFFNKGTILNSIKINSISTIHRV